MVRNWIDTLKDKTGRTLEEWSELVRKKGPKTTAERRAWLKSDHGLGTNSAWWIVTDAGTDKIHLVQGNGSGANPTVDVTTNLPANCVPANIATPQNVAATTNNTRRPCATASAIRAAVSAATSCPATTGSILSS